MDKYTTSNIKIKKLYKPKDLGNFDYDSQLGEPGKYPFTRGVYDSGYRGRLWTMRQYAGFGTAKQSNERYKYLLEQGQTGLSVAFDLPTQMGIDSDNEMAKGEVGKVGVAIDTLDDMETLFNDIPLDKVSTSMTINSTAMILLAMYIVVAKKNNISSKKLSGTIQNDILKEYLARGTYIFPPNPSLNLIVDIFRYCAKNVPRWNTISISGYHIREAGATAVQELAFTFANAIIYVEKALEAGLAPTDFLPRLSFFFNAHNNLFEEVAKFRAARRIWAKIVKERFNVNEPKSQRLRFHTQTGGSTLTATQIENNIIRVTLQALSAVLGGTQSLHTNSKDEALSLPTESSARTALRTQQIIAYESGAADTIDPLAGSYYIENLTNEIENRVFEYLDKIEQWGGTVKAIESGKIKQEIENSAYNYQMQIENGELKIIGVNIFQEGEEKVPLFEIDPNIEQEQIKRLKEIKTNRSNDKVKKSLDKIKQASEQGKYIFEAVIEAVENYTSIGEIVSVWKDLWGNYEEHLT